MKTRAANVPEIFRNLILREYREILALRALRISMTTCKQLQATSMCLLKRFNRASQAAVPRDGIGSVGHESWVKWVTIFGWVTDHVGRSWVTAGDPLTHDDEITVQ